ncbi:hypothetical protein BDV12DRAFT_150005 [Aspergillus spectabilis]
MMADGLSTKSPLMILLLLLRLKERISLPFFLSRDKQAIHISSAITFIQSIYHAIPLSPFPLRKSFRKSSIISIPTRHNQYNNINQHKYVNPNNNNLKPKTRMANLSYT